MKKILSLLSLSVFIFSQMLMPGYTHADMGKVTTKIKHKPIEYYVPGKRINLEISATDKHNIHTVRCYFKTTDESDFVFVPMNSAGKDTYRGVLPAPAKHSESIQYLFLTVNSANQVIKTQVFKVRKKDTKDIPDWQKTDDSDDTIVVMSEIEGTPAKVPGFSDSITMDVVESSARFGIVAGGLYSASSIAAGTGAGAAAGTAGTAGTSGAAASATTATVSASTGISTAAAVGYAALGVAAVGVGVASSDSGGSSGGSDGGTDSNTDTGDIIEDPETLIDVSGLWNYTATITECGDFVVSGTVGFVFHSAGSWSAAVAGQDFDLDCSVVPYSCSEDGFVERNPMNQTEFQNGINSWGCLDDQFQVTEFTDNKIILKGTTNSTGLGTYTITLMR